MAISWVSPGDISTNDNVDTVTGVSFTGLNQASGDYLVSVWGLLTTATTVVQDARLTTIEDHTDQNLRTFLSSRTMTGSESGTVSYTVDAASLNRMSVALGMWRGVGSVGTAVRFTEGGTAVANHPATNNLSITPIADNALIVLVYSERSSTGNTAGTLAAPTGPGGGSATIRRERGTGGSGGVYVQIAEFQLGAGTSGVAQNFTQWVATPNTLIASNADMWLVALYPAATDATPAPAAVAAVVALPQAVPAVDDVGAPAQVVTTVALPQATVSGNATVTPATITAVAALPTASPQTSGNATATPAAVVSTVALPAAAPSGTAKATPAQVVTSVALPQAAPLAGATVSPAVVVTVVAVPRASVSVSAGPAQIVTVAGLPLAVPVATRNATAAPVVVVVVAGVPTPTVVAAAPNGGIVGRPSVPGGVEHEITGVPGTIR